ncbi:hypothetical protein GOV07_02190 [Candidatus Woesearchaeota archaeon]|nr:hypothetical protein [Candidatus Woesearchaeota archaeon]
MPKLVHHVTLEVFSKAHDSIATAYRALDALVPVPMEEVLKMQWHWHPDKEHTKVYELPKKGISVHEAETAANEGTMTVLTYRFTKQRDTNAFIAKLKEIPAEQRKEIMASVDTNIDEKGKLKVRLDMDTLDKGKVSLGGERQVMARLNLAAYPKNWDTCIELAKKVLGVEA